MENDLMRSGVPTIARRARPSPDTGAAVSGSNTRGGARSDRAGRTRAAIVAAFSGLVMERGYARVTVRDVIARANVGRSTFYEHFDGKLDVLEEAMSVVLVPLADAVGTPRAGEGLRFVVDHVRAQRKLALGLVGGAARPHVARLLASVIERRIESGVAHEPAMRPLVAAAVASAQLALLECWLARPAQADPANIACALASMSYASARATVRHGPSSPSPSPA